MTSPAFNAAVHILSTLPTVDRDAISEALSGHECSDCGTRYNSPNAAQHCCTD